MSEPSLKKKTFAGVFWKFMERICARVVSIVVAIILARILLPEDYSVVSIVTIFFAFCDVLISGGLNSALIQKKDADTLDYATILYSNLVLATLLYITLFLSAPWIANVFNSSIVCPVLRVMSLMFFINGIKAVICAKVSNELGFRKFFLATIIGTIVSAIVGIWMAQNGFGAWALVAQQMSNSLIDTIILWIVTKFHVPLRFSSSRFKPLFKYGGKLMLGSIIDVAYDKVRPLIVGIKYSGTDLSYYDKGQSFPVLVNSTISETLSSVLFPVMSKVQHNKDQLLSITRRFIQVCSYIIFPVMLGLFAVSDSFVLILLTEKWMPASAFIKIFCIAYMFNIVQTGNIQPIKALGRSDVLLLLDILKKFLYACVIIAFVLFTNSSEMLACTSIITSLIALIANTTANRKLLGYRFKNQMIDIFQNLIPSAIMCIIVYLIGFARINMYVLFFIQIFSGIIVYLLISIFCRNQSLYYLLNSIRGFVRGYKQENQPEDNSIEQ